MNRIKKTSVMNSELKLPVATCPRVVDCLSWR